MLIRDCRAAAAAWWAAVRIMHEAQTRAACQRWRLKPDAKHPSSGRCPEPAPRPATASGYMSCHSRQVQQLKYFTHLSSPVCITEQSQETFPSIYAAISRCAPVRQLNHK